MFTKAGYLWPGGVGWDISKLGAGTPFGWHHSDVSSSSRETLQLSGRETRKDRWLPGRPTAVPGNSWVVSCQPGSCMAWTFPKRPAPSLPFSPLSGSQHPLAPWGFLLTSALWSCISLATPFFVTLENRHADHAVFQESSLFLIKKKKFIVENWQNVYY